MAAGETRLGRLALSATEEQLAWLAGYLDRHPETDRDFLIEYITEWAAGDQEGIADPESGVINPATPANVIRFLAWDETVY